METPVSRTAGIFLQFDAVSKEIKLPLYDHICLTHGAHHILCIVFGANLPSKIVLFLLSLHLSDIFLFIFIPPPVHPFEVSFHITSQAYSPFFILLLSNNIWQGYKQRDLHSWNFMTRTNERIKPSNVLLRDQGYKISTNP